MDHGERDTLREINRMVTDPEEEFKRRLNGPHSIFYYNKERQAKHEEKMRKAYYEFIDPYT